MLKILGRVLLALAVALSLAAAVVHFRYEAHRRERIALDPPEISLPTDAASLAEGRRLVQVKGCYDCHGADLSGRVFADAGPVGFFAGANITPAGTTKDYGVRDWVRAVRYGLNPEGRKLIFMPSTEFAQLTNEDLGKIIAHLRTARPVQNQPAALSVGPLGKVLYLAGKFPLMFQAELIDRTAVPLESLAPSTEPGYGKYMIASCTGCHGADLRGGPIPGVPPEWPPASDLTPTGRVQTWTLQQFATAVKTGTKPDGRQINPAHMPWTSFAAMTDVEIEAMYRYIRSQ